MREARGVGTYSKTYPGMLGLKSISLPLIILVSETPIILNSMRGICPPCQSRGGGAFANFALPVGRAFANPGATPSFGHARGFLSKYNYTEDFTGKTSRLAHFSRTGKN